MVLVTVYFFPKCVSYILISTDRGGHRDPLQAERHRGHYQAKFPERSHGRGEEPAPARRPDHRWVVLRRGSQKSAVRDVQAAVVRQGLRVVFYR